jgi:hypothetical protein
LDIEKNEGTKFIAAHTEGSTGFYDAQVKICPLKNHCIELLGFLDAP